MQSIFDANSVNYSFFFLLKIGISLLLLYVQYEPNQILLVWIEWWVATMLIIAGAKMETLEQPIKAEETQYAHRKPNQ